MMKSSNSKDMVSRAAKAVAVPLMVWAHLVMR